MLGPLFEFGRALLEGLVTSREGFFSGLTGRHIQRNSRDAHGVARRITLRARHTVVPRHPSVWLDEPMLEIPSLRPVRPAHGVDGGADAGAVVPVDAREKAVERMWLVRVQAEPLSEAIIALDRFGLDVLGPDRRGSGRDRGGSQAGSSDSGLMFVR